MNKQMKSLISKSFNPPKPTRSETFIETLNYPKANMRELIVSQLGFIRKRVWITYMILVALALFYVNVSRIPDSITLTLSALLPFVSLSAVMEVYKSTVFQMEELELSCKHNLSRLTMIRLGILAGFSMIIFSLFILLAMNNHMGLLRNLAYLGVPYLLSINVSLMIVMHFKSRETVYVCFGVSSFISIFMYFMNTYSETLYHGGYTFIWLIMFLGLLVAMFRTVKNFINNQGELRWSLT